MGPCCLSPLFFGQLDSNQQAMSQSTRRLIDIPLCDNKMGVFQVSFFSRNVWTVFLGIQKYSPPTFSLKLRISHVLRNLDSVVEIPPNIESQPHISACRPYVFFFIVPDGVISPHPVVSQGQATQPGGRDAVGRGEHFCVHRCPDVTAAVEAAG